MAPKRKGQNKTSDVKEEGVTQKSTVVQTKPVALVQQPKKDTSLTTIIKPEVQKEKPKAVVPLTNIIAQNPLPKVTDKQPQSQSTNKTIKLETNQAHTEEQLRQLRKLRFNIVGTQVDVEEAERIRLQRLKKFGGQQFVSKEELKKRAEKFGSTFVDKNEEKQKILARRQKFGLKNTNDNALDLANEDKNLIEQRRKKFGLTATSNNDQASLLEKRKEKFNISDPSKKIKA